VMPVYGENIFSTRKDYVEIVDKEPSLLLLQLNTTRRRIMYTKAVSLVLAVRFPVTCLSSALAIGLGSFLRRAVTSIPSVVHNLSMRRGK
jgi:hypothetical protein